jgi:hypothetical protein
LFRCDVWGWKGHIWERPKYNNALQRIDVIEKCRCGKTREVKQFVPMPDMEPIEQEVEVYDITASLASLIGKIITLIIFIVFTSVILVPLLLATLSGDYCGTIVGNGTC